VSGRARRKLDVRKIARAMGRRAAETRIAFAVEAMTGAALPGLLDPVCARACGRCHWCLRAKYGPVYWLRGAP
jgi:hypothetical protein